jgi:hypothetical protein
VLVWSFQIHATKKDPGVSSARRRPSIFLEIEAPPRLSLLGIVFFAIFSLIGAPFWKGGSPFSFSASGGYPQTREALGVGFQIPATIVLPGNSSVHVKGPGNQSLSIEFIWNQWGEANTSMKPI